MAINKPLYRTLALAIVGALLAACSANGLAKNPGVTQANLASNTLEFAVGTARIGQDSTVGMNFVATLRQPNGLTGVLASMPTISGPAGFVVPANAPGAYSAGTNVDAGTNHLSGSPQVPRNNVGLVNSTFGTFTGVFSYGFGPFNSDQSIVNGAYYPGSPNASGGNGFTRSNYNGTSLVAAISGGDVTQPLPFLAASAPMEYITGPPAVPFFNDGTFPTGFAGYSPGFTSVEIPPAAGQYTLSVLVAAQNAAPFTYTQTATLTSAVALPPMAAPTFAGDAAGGGTGAVNVPAGVTETVVYIVDANTGLFFAVGPIAGIGVHPFTLPDKLGPCVGSGCQNGASATNSLNTGDTYFVAAVGYDYPAFEAAPPGNTQQSPTITGANGQADITMSPVLQATY
ncbi:MAG: hypothetical protein M3Z37_04400 [Candidatus Eremiobacteraeota bacterium]|nr:hypothetical protein [Candidatus Eremiobacteraeota bacterium]